MGINRRQFVSVTLAGSGLAGAARPAQESSAGAPTQQELREFYRRQLFDRFLLFMDRHVVDRQYGGFLCSTGHTGERASTAKLSWYEGRGIWVYSFLYNRLQRDEQFLETARRSVQFLEKIEPRVEGILWPRDLSREGQILGPPESAVYGAMFIAEGLAEFAQATGLERYREKASRMVLQCMERFDRPDYNPEIGQTYLGPAAPPVPGARVLGVWMVLLRATTQMLAHQDDPRLRGISDRCVEAVRLHHWNPEFGLLNELINHDLSRPDNEYARLVYTGHAIETLWMLLQEAERRRDSELFNWTAVQFRRHVEVAWDDVYGGVFRNLQDVEANLWSLDKVLWAQEEVLIGSLLIALKTGQVWAWDLFHRTLAYVRRLYPLDKLGSPIWIHSSDRRVSLEEYLRRPARVEHYHHPRHLMLNLLMLGGAD